MEKEVRLEPVDVSDPDSDEGLGFGRNDGCRRSGGPCNGDSIVSFDISKPLGGNFTRPRPSPGFLLVSSVGK